MINPQTANPIPPQNAKLYRPVIPAWALFVRAIPLIASFLIFILAASADVNKLGSKGIQTMLVSAAVLGIVGIAVFIPKR